MKINPKYLQDQGLMIKAGEVLQAIVPPDFFVEDGSPPLWLAYRCSEWLHYGESAREDREHLIDADTDQFALIKRVNEHFAQERTIRSERGLKLVIPAFKMKSDTLYCGGGGGTNYNVHIEVRQAPRINPDACDRAGTYTTDFLCTKGTWGCKHHPEGRKLTKPEVDMHSRARHGMR